MNDIGIALLHEVAGKEGTEGNDAPHGKIDTLASTENDKILSGGDHPQQRGNGKQRDDLTR